jgi:hypothetical protein
MVARVRISAQLSLSRFAAFVRRKDNYKASLNEFVYVCALRHIRNRETRSLLYRAGIYKSKVHSVKKIMSPARQNELTRTQHIELEVPCYIRNKK